MSSHFLNYSHFRVRPALRRGLQHLAPHSTANRGIQPQGCMQDSCSPPFDHLGLHHRSNKITKLPDTTITHDLLPLLHTPCIPTKAQTKITNHNKITHNLHLCCLLLPVVCRQQATTLTRAFSPRNPYCMYVLCRLSDFGRFVQCIVHARREEVRLFII